MVMGWQLVSSHKVPRSTAPTGYTVTYDRLFERGIDDHVLAIHLHEDWWTQVLSTPRRCLSWEAVYEEAIAGMRDAVARRRDSGRNP
jgi:hypothetical protein